MMINMSNILMLAKFTVEAEMQHIYICKIAYLHPKANV